MADAPDLGSGPERGRGSSPLSRTNQNSTGFNAKGLGREDAMLADSDPPRGGFPARDEHPRSTAPTGAESKADRMTRRNAGTKRQISQHKEHKGRKEKLDRARNSDQDIRDIMAGSVAYDICLSHNSTGYPLFDAMNRICRISEPGRHDVFSVLSILLILS